MGHPDTINRLSIERIDGKGTIGRRDVSGHRRMLRRCAECAGTLPIRKEPWAEEVERIRDRVTISSWGYATTVTRSETYDRNGKMRWIDPPVDPFACPAPREPLLHRDTLEGEIVCADVQPPADPGSRRILVWFPVRALPGPT